jgi:hypothetical protein
MADERAAALLRVREWFAPALGPSETLQGALATTPFDLSNPYSPAAVGHSLLAAGQALTGNNQGRVLLLTDTSIHVARRRFWKRRFKALEASYPVGGVRVTAEGNGLRIGDQVFFPNWTGFQLGGAVGGPHDVQLLLEAGGS